MWPMDATCAHLGSRRIALLVALAGATATGSYARAEDGRLDDGRTASTPSYVLEVGAGYAIRGDYQTGPAGIVETRGGAVSHGRIAASIYPGGGVLGLWIHAAGDRFVLTDKSSPLMPEALDASLFTTAAALAIRTHPGRALSAEGIVGYSLQTSPLFGFQADLVSMRPVRDHGPLIGARARWAPTSWLSLDVRGRGIPVSFGASVEEASLSGRHLEAGGGISVGNLRLGTVRVATVLDYGYGLATLRGESVDLTLSRHLLAVGLRISQTRRPTTALARTVAPGPPPRASQRIAAAAPPPVEPPRPEPQPEPPPQSTSPPNEAPPAEIQTPSGAVSGRLWARTVSAVPGRARRVPLANAEVTWRPLNADSGPVIVRSNARGRFTLDGLSPGDGTLRIEAPGYEPVDKPLALGATENQEVDLTLDATAQSEKAIIRGTIRSMHGRRVKATLAIPEAKIKSKPNRNGDFVFEVAPGRYTLKVSASGYATQRKAVELAGGEESIFSIELRRRHR
jgi:hypothetical protein